MYVKKVKVILLNFNKVKAEFFLEFPVLKHIDTGYS